MVSYPGAGLWLAAAMLCLIGPAEAEPQNRRECLPRLEDCVLTGQIAGLVSRLEAWLDSESGYPRRDDPPKIRTISAADAALVEPANGFTGSRRRGLYLPEVATVFLVEPWSRHDPRDVSVLLHELVHHRQVGARHWYCDGEQELPAYRIQQKWLNQRGMEANVNWVAVVLEAGCKPRDIHP